MSDLTNSPHLDAWRMFLTLHAKLVDAIDTDLQQTGELPLTHYDILIELFEADGKRLRMHELAQQVLLSRSSITRLADQLAKKGFLEREPDPEDRRGSYAVLTPAGEQALRSAWPHYAQAIQHHFGRFLTEEEAAILFKLFTRISEENKPPT